MQFLKPKSSKKEKKPYIDQNPYEALTSIGTGMIDSVKKDLLREGVYEARDEIAGKGKAEKSGDLSEGAELNLAEEKTVQITEQGRSFVQEVIHAGERAQAQTSQETAVKIQEILIEINALSKSSKELEKQVEVAVIEQATQKPGAYHLNFVEKLLLKIREARENVEDSLAWFKALGSKKAARQYGAMAKRHGTSFSLSNERVVATQTG